MRRLIASLALAALVAPASAAEPATIAVPANRLSADNPAWVELAKGLRDLKAVTADFTEYRRFAVKKTPTVLKGEVRVSGTLGLSLHYLGTDEQIVIVDDRGMLIRTKSGDKKPPSDPRATAANTALLNAMRLDLQKLSATFEMFGTRSGDSWKLALVPKDASLKKAMGQISIDGEGAAVRRIELQAQRVEILIGAPRIAKEFSPEETKGYFRRP